LAAVLPLAGAAAFAVAVDPVRLLVLAPDLMLPVAAFGFLIYDTFLLTGAPYFYSSSYNNYNIIMKMDVTICLHAFLPSYI
jgi:hypothetical protein